MNIKDKISFWSASYVIGLLPSEDFPAIADELIQNGYESPELLMLSLPSEANHDTYKLAFEELGFTFPSKGEAERIVIGYYVENLIGSDDPLGCLDEIKHLRDWICPVKEGCRMCTFPDLNKLANCYWAYEDLIEFADTKDSRDKLTQDVLSLAVALRDECPIIS